MRKILFRGKRIDNGEWVLSHNIMVFKDGECQRTFMAGETENPIQVNVSPNGNLGLLNALECGLPLIDNSTIGQYTGFTDKNGKKIFEGDIIGTRIWSEWDDTTVWREGPVIFENGGFFIKTSDTLHVAIGEERYEEPYFKILGNIYDNPEMLPELLKGANNHDD